MQTTPQALLIHGGGGGGPCCESLDYPQQSIPRRRSAAGPWRGATWQRASKALRPFRLSDPVIPVLGMWPREITRVTENAFHPTLFMIVQYWGAPECPALVEW